MERGFSRIWRIYADLKASKASRGFNGFSRITRIGSWGNPRQSAKPDKIRVICVNPCLMVLKSASFCCVFLSASFCRVFLNSPHFAVFAMVFVGDGFIRPEVASFCVNGRYPSRIDERACLGADKSAPYD